MFLRHIMLLQFLLFSSIMYKYTAHNYIENVSDLTSPMDNQPSIFYAYRQIHAMGSH